MANYHVGCSPVDNKIYAGTTNKAMDKWTNKSEVTEEALLAVGTHFLKLAEINNEQELGYKWNFADGSAVVLTARIEVPEKGDSEDAGDKVD